MRDPIFLWQYTKSCKFVHHLMPSSAVISEIHSINENDLYFKEVIHDIGLKLKSTAVCTHIHRQRYGPFTLKHALLMQQWSLENILKNLNLCRRLLTPETLFTDVTVTGENKWEIGEKDSDTEDMIKKMIKQGEGSGG